MDMIVMSCGAMHHCHANGCKTETPQRLFMCHRHWAMLPREMRKAVWTAYKANPDSYLRGRSRDYMEACADAVEHVAAIEGFPTGNSYRRICLLRQVE